MTPVQIVILALVLLRGQPTTSQQNVPVHILRRNDMTCPHVKDRERARNEILTNVQSHLATEMSPSLPIYWCGGSPGWTRIAYLNMSLTLDRVCIGK